MILLTRYMYMFTCPTHYDCLLFGLGYGKKRYSWVSLSFVQEVSGVFQLGIFSFSYERK